MEGVSLGSLCEVPYMLRIRPFGAVAAMMFWVISFSPNCSYLASTNAEGYLPYIPEPGNRKGYSRPGPQISILL